MTEQTTAVITVTRRKHSAERVSGPLAKLMISSVRMERVLRRRKFAMARETAQKLQMKTDVVRPTHKFREIHGKFRFLINSFEHNISFLII